jgi:hypothetical protein
MKSRPITWFVLLLAFSTAVLSSPQDPIPTTVEFNRHVRPILSDKCYSCHGPGTQMAGLRFDREEDAKKALRSGRLAIVPGDPASSEMIRRVSLTDAAARMPQKGEALSARDIAVLRRWVEQGASWEKHWSFIPPKRSEPPQTQDRGWAKNPIDSFVLERLEREGLKPSQEAERSTWLRRVTLDLTGLPPTIADIDAFLRDSGPNAYEKVVDRLLQSPRYGERMAFPWLEAARYADSNGYQSDGERHMWRWRDWVIDAFNRNVPFDHFTIEQIAGDMLPNPTLDQRIATGFNRNHRGNSEGGVIPEEYAVEYVVDRVDTTSTVFLGLTMGCARCHSHKFDPIPHKDYYQLFAYFNNVPEFGKARRQGNSPPFIKAPTREQQPELERLDRELASADAAFSSLQPELARAQREWERTLDKSTPLAWGPKRGLVAHYPLDGNLTAPVSLGRDGRPIALRAQTGQGRFASGPVGQAAVFDGSTSLQSGDITGFDSHGFYDDKYSITAWIRSETGTGAIVSKSADVFEPTGHGLQLKDGKVQYNYVSKWVDEGIRLQSQQAVSLNEWHQITLAYDGSRYAEGVKLYVDGELWKWEVLLDDLNNPRPLQRQPLRIGAGGGADNRFRGIIDDVRVYDRDLTAAEAKVLATTAPVTEIAALPEEQRTQAQKDKIRDYFIENTAPANLRQAWNTLLEARAKRNAFYESIPTVMVMEDMPAPRQSFILLRGSYERPGDKVGPTLPTALVSPEQGGKYPPNRLGLAKWFVDPENPLLARVTVNRFWQMYFGAGLVKTAEDFGSQGELPSHPELLDWLATEFIRSGWDVKALQKLIVTSATYRQSSKITPELLQKDPENRLLARGPSVRLGAEVVRDQALAIAGLLVDRIGGPSVYPYQPEGIWRELNSYEDYKVGTGADLYRRSLYTFWKRSAPPPTMANFDASGRESCVVRLNSTNTPLQALDLMNNVQFVEAARVLGERMMKAGGATVQERLTFAFRLATARPPRPAEATILKDAFDFQLSVFRANPAAAAKYISIGESRRDPRLDPAELAAYASVASLILNQSQTVTKE